MIKLTKLNGERFVLNCEQIVAIECIPESKILLNNLSFYIVRETPDEIIDKSIKYLSAIHTFNICPRE
mgnify:CR=1 FL=1